MNTNETNANTDTLTDQERAVIAALRAGDIPTYLAIGANTFSDVAAPPYFPPAEPAPNLDQRDEARRIMVEDIATEMFGTLIKNRWIAPRIFLDEGAGGLFKDLCDAAEDSLRSADKMQIRRMFFKDFD